MSMNKKDNRKSLMKHRAQIQQLKDQIKAKEEELAKLTEITRAEEETEIVLLLQTHQIGLEDMERMLSEVRQSADISATQEKPATAHPVFSADLHASFRELCFRRDE